MKKYQEDISISFNKIVQSLAKHLKQTYSKEVKDFPEQIILLDQLLFDFNLVECYIGKEQNLKEQSTQQLMQLKKSITNVIKSQNFQVGEQTLNNLKEFEIEEFLSQFNEFPISKCLKCQSQKSKLIEFEHLLEQKEQELCFIRESIQIKEKEIQQRDQIASQLQNEKHQINTFNQKLYSENENLKEQLKFTKNLLENSKSQSNLQQNVATQIKTQQIEKNQQQKEKQEANTNKETTRLKSQSKQNVEEEIILQKCDNIKCPFQQQNKEKIKLKCNHTFCNQCLVEQIKKYTNNKMNILQFESDYVQIKCTKCHQQIQQEEFINILGKDYYQEIERNALQRKKFQLQQEDQKFNMSQNNKIQINQKDKQEDQKQKQKQENVANLKCNYFFCKSLKTAKDMVELGCQHVFCRFCLIDKLSYAGKIVITFDFQKYSYKKQCPQCIYSLNEKDFIQILGQQQYDLLQQEALKKEYGQEEEQSIKKQEEEKLAKIQFKCLKCLETKINEEKINLETCGHAFCKSCLKKRIESDTRGYLVTVEKDIYYPRCNECYKKLNQEDIKSVLGEELYDQKYQEAIQRNYVNEKQLEVKQFILYQNETKCQMQNCLNYSSNEKLLKLECGHFFCQSCAKKDIKKQTKNLQVDFQISDTKKPKCQICKKQHKKQDIIKIIGIKGQNLQQKKQFQKQLNQNSALKNIKNSRKLFYLNKIIYFCLLNQILQNVFIIQIFEFSLYIFQFQLLLLHFNFQLI